MKSGPDRREVLKGMANLATYVVLAGALAGCMKKTGVGKEGEVIALPEREQGYRVLAYACNSAEGMRAFHLHLKSEQKREKETGKNIDSTELEATFKKNNPNEQCKFGPWHFRKGDLIGTSTADGETLQLWKLTLMDRKEVYALN